MLQTINGDLLDQEVEGKFKSIALPLIRAGTGGFSEDKVEAIMKEAIIASPYAGEVIIVKYKK
jgi:O-acetyl-ADP-ribose deacetylase (regulator of RNase III)